MDNAVPLDHCGLGEVVVEELDSFGVTQCFGHPVHHVKSAVVAEGGANIEALAAAEVPRPAAARLVVDDDGTAQRAKRCGVKVEGDIEMFPHGHLRGKGRLSQEVQRELYLQ